MMRREINFSVPVIIRIIEIPWHQCAINWVTALLLRVNGTCRLSFCYLNIFCQANKKYTQKNITPSRFICYWAKKHASIKKIQIFSNCKEIVRPCFYSRFIFFFSVHKIATLRNICQILLIGNVTKSHETSAFFFRNQQISIELCEMTFEKCLH